MPAINEVVDLTLEDGVALITLDNPPVNALSPKLMDGMHDAFVQAIGDPEVRAILLLCAGRTFIAGADIKALGVESPKVDFFELQGKIEGAGKPVVAALHGTCLGGGLEVALTCHYRIAASGTKLGLPEVNLGLLPGGGGTQRLPRIVGIAAALDLLVSGRQVDASGALSVGLVDVIADVADLTAAAKSYVRALLAEGRPAKRVRDLTDKIGDADAAVFEAARAQAEKLRHGEEAPRAIIRCVEAAARGDFDAGIAVERAEFQKLLDGPQSAALRYAFFAERQAAKVAGLAPDVQPRAVTRAGVAGAGPIGSGIAAALLDAGIETTLFDADAVALSDAGAAIDRPGLTLAGSPDHFAACDLVVEAVADAPEAKQAILAELDQTAPGALLATSTTHLDVDALARATARPGRVIGLHFLSSGSANRVLEIVRGKATSDEAVATAFTLARKLKRVGVLSGIGPGFIGQRSMRVLKRSVDAMIGEGVEPEAINRVATEFGFAAGLFVARAVPGAMTQALSDDKILDRLLIPLINEAAHILGEGIAQRGSDIDMVWVHGYGWPAWRGGPIYHADLIGLSVVIQKVRSLGLNPAPRLIEYAAAGRKLGE
ncbi:enoyl-CoA hydratase-related protein [Sphingomonas turrisvirgatae]|uniref:3-hydroxyacyl-CoA dehydrogenase n=1 Tax=Sphingomonas turrisvirgatae TaxID=1888892 RepID=A0A1E3LXH5_9SPHN|nr:enoyl-CoA hydratase-related protein [Sphingomonas turrisvirgatae]ODP38446.1 hypothetical protein BFL28_13775 [Sphingomonas turrisvirgatae]